MLSLYILAFCRLTIGLVFLVAFIGKVRDIKAFQLAITNFRLLPTTWSFRLACLILGNEVSIILCMIFGSVFLLPGFLLAAALLLAFSAALAFVIARKQRIHCNCFGTSNQEVGQSDLYRNGGFILCAVTGCVTQQWSSQSPILDVLQWILIALAVTVFVLLWTQLQVLLQLFR